MSYSYNSNELPYNSNELPYNSNEPIYNMRHLLFHLPLLAGLAAATLSCGAPAPPPPAPEGMVFISGTGDQPAFYMDATEVTVAEFTEFVAATGYVTEAEDFGWSGVFMQDSLGWVPVDSTDWRYPRGPAAAAARPDEPVTQVSYRDATAYADWAGKRLPTREEWVYAAAQGEPGRPFPWGRELRPDGQFLGNWWQGPFPYEDLVMDKFPGVAPVRSFPPAPNGLYDVSGNVWEWTSTRDPRTGQYVIKGGSFLCSTSYCTGFDLRQEQLTPADSGLNHLGFRCLLPATAR